MHLYTLNNAFSYDGAHETTFLDQKIQAALGPPSDRSHDQGWSPSVFGAP